MKVGIYNRYWNTMGGGEKYVGRIAEVLSASHEVDLISVEPFTKCVLEKRLHLDLGACRIRVLGGATDSELEDDSESYDLWINATYISSLIPKAKKSALVVFFPFLDRYLFRFWQIAQIPLPKFLQRLSWRKHGFWKSYDLIFSISDYTQQWVSQWWDAPSCVLPPPVDQLGVPEGYAKEKKILSVGRFFVGSHCKKQEVLIENFRRMYDEGGCGDWEYHLCGGTHSEQCHQDYLSSLQQRAAGYPIFIHPDMGHDDLIEMYRSSSIFWHATGFGMNEVKNPAAFEHFGITTVEAMSAGCVPVVINKAGQCEIVHSGRDGMLWDSLDEQRSFTRKLMEDPELIARLGKAAVYRAANYSSEVFDASLTRFLVDANIVNPIQDVMY